jgi:predicted PurR-regulated permease PerM
MMGFDARAARAAWSVFLVALLLAIVYSIRRILLVFVLAILFAYMLSPIVNLLDRLLPSRRSRAYSLALVYALLVGVLITAGFLIGSKAAGEASALATGYPKIVDNLKHTLEDPRPAWLHPIKQYILVQIDEQASSFGSAVLPVMRQLSGHVASVLTSAAFVVLIPILSFFFLKDGRELKEQILSRAGIRRALWEDIVADLHVLLGQFIRAIVLLSVATLTVYTIAFTIIGLPYSVLLACLAALLEFIPVVGPVVASAAILLVTAFSGAASVFVVIGFLVVYRIFQDYGLSPRLMGAGVALHPLLVIFGALAGEEVAGIPGMFLSVPVLAALRVVYSRIRKARVAPDPEPATVQGP